jgi:23S rRNA pseudouridine1911/1915/1917 synthase
MTVPAHCHEKRVDAVLATLLPTYSRSRIKTWIDKGEVLCNGKKIAPKHKVCEGDELAVQTVFKTEGDWAAQDIALDIIFEDDEILLVNKPAGLVVHPGAGNPDRTLVNALLYHLPALKKLPRAGLVHRLDKATTGLLVVAKTLRAHTSLVAQLQARTIKREYEAIVNGTLTGGGKVVEPMGRHPRNRVKMAIVTSGKFALTHYRIIERFSAHTRLKILLETGRTHQIRVHMAHVYHPVLGDPLYGNQLFCKGLSSQARSALKKIQRQMLHARRLTLEHPATGEILSWKAPLPQDMVDCLALLKEIDDELD